MRMHLWTLRSRCADRVMATSRDNAMRSGCGSLSRRAHEDGGMRLLPQWDGAGGRQRGVSCVRPASLVEPLQPARNRGWSRRYSPALNAQSHSPHFTAQRRSNSCRSGVWECVLKPADRWLHAIAIALSGRNSMSWAPIYDHSSVIFPGILRIH